jgi:outer membrane protein OmpA-like peptidoglycan-associated protein
MQRSQEPTEESAGAATDTALRLVTEKHTVRRPPRGGLLVAGLLLPALAAAGGGFLAGAAAEEALVSDARAELKSQRVTGVRLEADGPFVTAFVPTRIDPRAVDRVVSGVDGVSDVRTEEVYSSRKEARACTNLAGKLNRATGRQRIPFEGESTRLTEAGRRMVVAAARLVAACGTARVYVGGHTASQTFDGSTLTLRRSRVMIALMRRSGVPEARLVPRGYGAQYPVAEGDSPAAQSRNQRGSIIPVEG